MRKLLVLAALFVATPGVCQGTLTGTISQSSGSGIPNATITLTLSQPAYKVGSFASATSPIYCYTGSASSSQAGNILGLPDPLVTAATTTNYGSGTLASGTYYVKYTYYGTSVETLPSPESTQILSSTGSLIITAPSLHPPSATGWKAYVGATSGSEKLQVTQAGWTNITVSSSLLNVTSPPSTNNSVCTFWFNDSFIPSYTTYSMLVQDVHGAQVRGWPQNYYFAGSTANISNMTPAGNISAKFPSAIIASPSSGATQSINGGLTVTGVLAAPDLQMGYQTTAPTTINSSAGWLYTKLSGAHSPLESTIFYQDGTGNAIDLLSTVASFSWPVGTAAGTGNYVGNGNGTTTYFLGTMPGTSGSGNPVAFVTNGVERARVTAGGAWCFGCTVPATPVQITDAAGVPLRIVGPNTGGLGVAMQFYEGSTATAQLTAAAGAGFSIATAISTPINLYNAGSLSFQTYRTSGDSIGAFQAGAEWVGVATGAVGVPASNKGRIIYDSSLQHFYASENGGAYTQLCLSGGTCGSGGGTSWNASSTLAGTNSNTGTTYLGGNNTAAAAMAFVTNQLERGRVTGAGLWGFNTTAPARVVDIADTGGIPMRLTGPATGGVGTQMEFYETSTLAATILAAKSSAMAISTVGATPITLNPNSTQVFKAYFSGGDRIGQFVGGAEFLGVATGAVGVSPASDGRIIYDSTLQHFYFSENGGAYAQLAGGGGSGWPIGTAAGSGTYNNPGAGPYFIGLLNTGAFGIATNSAQAMYITAAQKVIVGPNTSCGAGVFCVFSGASATNAGFDSTGTATTVVLTNSSVTQGTLTTDSTVPAFTVAANGALRLTGTSIVGNVCMVLGISSSPCTSTNQLTLIGRAGNYGLEIDTPAASGLNAFMILKGQGTANAAIYSDGTDMRYTTNGNTTAKMYFGVDGSVTEALRITPNNGTHVPNVSIFGAPYSANASLTVNTNATNTMVVNGSLAEIDFASGGSVVSTLASQPSGTAFGSTGASNALSLYSVSSTVDITAGSTIRINAGISQVTTYSTNGPIKLPSLTLAAASTVLGDGYEFWCTDCKNSTQDAVAPGAACVGFTAHGNKAILRNTVYYCVL